MKVADILDVRFTMYDVGFFPMHLATIKLLLRRTLVLFYRYSTKPPTRFTTIVGVRKPRQQLQTLTAVLKQYLKKQIQFCILLFPIYYFLFPLPTSLSSL